MRALPLISLSLIGMSLQAQVPALKWRGSMWASAASSEREAPNGALFLRPVDGTRSGFTLDGLTLGVDADLGQGWSLKTTVTGGRIGELVNVANEQTGTLVLSEAQLVWTGEKDVLRLGRMNTFLGMEFLDGTQNLTASRGLLFSFAIPFTQVGLNWHHSFTSSWSSDLWVFNGEDRVADNNRGKTVGLGLNYNHGGASDKFVSCGAYRGPEQRAFGGSSIDGAEGRHRERFFLNGQWVWGAFTLQGEGEYARENVSPEAFGDSSSGAPLRSTWKGLGLIGRYQVTPSWALFGRGEYLRDDTGVRLAADPAVAGLLEPGTIGQKGLDLVATAYCAGVERVWGKVFTRLEARMDRLNRDIQGREGVFRHAASLTWSFGASF